MNPRQIEILKTVIFAACLVAFCLCFSGCVIGDKTGGAIWWNPTTWASRAAPAAVDRANDQRDAAAEESEKAKEAVIAAAQLEFAKTGEALSAAPVSRPVQLARRFNGNGLALLAQVRPLTAEEGMELRNLVADLLSDNQTIAQNAELRQLKDEAAATKLSRQLEEAGAKLARKDEALTKVNGNLREAYDRENALANQVRNFWFVIGGLALLWIGGTVLGAVAKVYPPLAPVSRAINGIAAPTLAFAEARATAGLQRIGRAMRTIKEKLPAAADQVVDIFDRETDADHQSVIGSAAKP